MKRFSSSLMTLLMLSIASCGGGSNEVTTSGVLSNPTAFQLAPVVSAVPPQN